MNQIDFPFAGRRRVRALFDAAPISSDGGSVLLRQVDEKAGVTKALADALPDRRDSRWTEHTSLELLRQRVYQICLGYEDCNDADTLRRDPALKVACGRDVDGQDLASQPTLSRFENQSGPKSCYLLGCALVDNYFHRHRRPPEALTLDLDTTDDITYGQQEFAAFHGFYGDHVYLPLLVFDQDGDLLAAMLQPGRPKGAGPTVALLERLLEAIRKKWPQVRITIRGDSGFASPEMYRLCERFGVSFIFGLQPNVRLKKLAAGLQEKARRRFLRRGEKARLFSTIRYRARRRWPRSYRVVIKAEHQSAGPNVRFVVTNLPGTGAHLYDAVYVQRAEACENSIKDLKNALSADRLSCHRFWANQFRLLLHAAAYVLMFQLRRAAHGTELARAQMDTLRLRLLKIAVRIESTARRIWFHLTSSCPHQLLWSKIARRLL